MTLSPLPSASSSSDLATQVARLFFDRQMTKIEIAGHLRISRFRVARLLDAALADGLVRIEYRDVPAEDRALATTLEERFGLDLCAVADVPESAEANSEDPVGPTARLAGSVLDGLIGPTEVIGIAWGSTMAAVVRHLPPRGASGIEVVQLAGSSSRIGRQHDAGELARTLAQRLGGTDHPVYAPVFVASPAIRRALVTDPEVAATMRRYDQLTLAVVGIGALGAGSRAPSSSLVRSGALAGADLARLTDRGAVGDLVVHPFDADGRFIAPDLAARAMAIGTEALRRVPRVVAVAAGAEKAVAIRGALATGLVRMLVTDRETARAVLASA